jgi:hypothetical protein
MNELMNECGDTRDKKTFTGIWDLCVDREGNILQGTGR